MNEIGLVDVLGHWIAIFITIATLSYLYTDNPFYKLAEHLFVGTSIGYVVVIQYFDVLKPNLIDRLTNPALGLARLIYVIPLLLVAFLFMRLSKRFNWIGRYPIAFLIGVYAGQNVPAYANADLVAQLHATVSATQDFATAAASHAGGSMAYAAGHWTDAVGLALLVLGMIAGLIYFFFSIEHRGPVGAVARVGVWVLMIGFGASFGYTVQGRISLAIGRAMYCLGSTQSEEEASAYHSRAASVVILIAVFTAIFLLERRRRRLETQA